MENLEIYKRSDKVSFMNTGTSSEPVYTRMQGFTEMNKSSNLKTYSRQYVDEDFEREDAIGYSTGIGYKFDRIVGNPVHEKIAHIADDELAGQSVDIVTVDFKKAVENKGYEARLRTNTVLPDAQGDGTDAYTYSGTFKKAGNFIKGTATVSADGLTAEFTPSNS